MNAELKSKKWLFGGIALQISIAYTVSFFVYQIGTLLTEKTLGNGFIPGITVIAVMFFIVLFLINKNKKGE